MAEAVAETETDGYPPRPTTDAEAVTKAETLVEREAVTEAQLRLRRRRVRGVSEGHQGMP